MDNHSISVRLVSASVVFMLTVTACGAPANATVTARGNTCTYAGPRQLSPAHLKITWDVQDTTPSMEYGFALVTFTDGKTAADFKQFIGVKDVLLSVKSAPDIPWLHQIDFASLVPKTTTATLDLTANGVYHGEPLYVICISHAAAFAVLGPLDVAQQ